MRYLTKYLKNCVLLLLSMFVQIPVFAQANAQKIDSLVANLGWKSITINCNALLLTLTHEDSTEQKLIRIGKPATAKLIESLADSNRTAIAHIILTQIWDRNRNNALITKYIYRDCNQLVGWHYVYNGLVWDWTSAAREYIRKSEIKKIEDYWKLRVAESKPVKFGYADIMDELERYDAMLYPCNKVYDNNSAFVTTRNLYELLGKKSTNQLFVRLWDKFGNDSTAHSYDDCFFITYQSEGLSFRFGRDSLLSAIFIEKEYRGQLPYSLKLTDTKAAVKAKIGKPDERGSYADNTWVWYKKQLIRIDFSKKGKIINFNISTL